MGWFRCKRFSAAEAIGLVSTGVLLVQIGDGLFADRLAGAADKAADPLQYLQVWNGTLAGLPGPHLIVTGANFHVRSGAGTTSEGNCSGATCSGRGNLIVGYNEGYAGHVRTGSHNLIVGPGHGFTSYGAILAGSHNRALAPHASVAGGQLNAATGNWSAVSGGKYNWASGNGAAILGGNHNRAIGRQSTVAGGGGATYPTANQAVGDYSAVTGGTGYIENAAFGVNGATRLTEFVDIETRTINGLAGPHVIVEGANLHVRSGAGTTDEGDCDLSGPACSGLGNLIVGYNEAEYTEPLIGRGGSHNLVIGLSHGFSGHAGLAAGQNNKISGRSPSVTGGFENAASSTWATVCGGEFNVASGERSVVCGGLNNSATGAFASVCGGGDNVASGFAASVSGGGGNTASGSHSSVTGGFVNTANGLYSTVLGGGGAGVAEGNVALGVRSTVVGDLGRIYRDIEDPGTLLH